MFAFDLLGDFWNDAARSNDWITQISPNVCFVGWSLWTRCRYVCYGNQLNNQKLLCADVVVRLPVLIKSLTNTLTRIRREDMYSKSSRSFTRHLFIPIYENYFQWLIRISLALSLYPTVPFLLHHIHYIGCLPTHFDYDRPRRKCWAWASRSSFISLSFFRIDYNWKERKSQK